MELSVVLVERAAFAPAEYSPMGFLLKASDGFFIDSVIGTVSILINKEYKCETYRSLDFSRVLCFR